MNKRDWQDYQHGHPKHLKLAPWTRMLEKPLVFNGTVFEIVPNTTLFLATRVRFLKFLVPESDYEVEDSGAIAIALKWSRLHFSSEFAARVMIFPAGVKLRCQIEPCLQLDNSCTKSIVHKSVFSIVVQVKLKVTLPFFSVLLFFDFWQHQLPFPLALTY